MTVNEARRSQSAGVGISLLPACRPAADEPVALSRGRCRRGWQFYGASEPAYQLAPGHPKQAQFQRLRMRRGPEKAICALAASILTPAYHRLGDATLCQDLGPNHFCRASPQTQAIRLARQIANVSFTGTRSSAAATHADQRPMITAPDSSLARFS
jgi:hypothetical protein